MDRAPPSQGGLGIAGNPRVLTRDEISALLSAAPTRYQPILGIAVLAGLRQQEVLGLRWFEVDFKHGAILVRQQLTRGSKDDPARPVKLKSKAGSRDVVLLPDLPRVLQQHLRDVEEESGLPRPGDFLFTTSTGQPLNYRNVSVRGVDKAADAANLNPVGKPRLTFHDLRHTFGSH